VSWELTIYTNELIDQKDVRIKHVSTNYIQVKGPYKDKVLINSQWDVKQQDTTGLLPYFVY
jgi:hypothetical protein